MHSAKLDPIGTRFDKFLPHGQIHIDKWVKCGPQWYLIWHVLTHGQAHMGQVANDQTIPQNFERKKIHPVVSKIWVPLEPAARQPDLSDTPIPLDNTPPAERTEGVKCIWKLSRALTLMMLGTEYPGFGCQYHALPMSWFLKVATRQCINRHGIDSIG